MNKISDSQQTVSQAQLLCSKGLFQKAQQKANLLFYQQQYQSAILIYQTIIQSNINGQYQIQGLGNCQQQTSYYEWKVSEWYEESLKDKVFKSNPYDALSLCYSITKQYAKGKIWYNSMIEKYSQNICLAFGLANIYYNSKEYEQALSLYLKIKEINPKLIKVYINIAFIFQFQRIQKSKAISYSKQALQLQPKNPFALFILARNQKKIDKRIQLLKQLSKDNPKNARIVNQIGIAYGGGKKNFDEAIFWYKQCVKIYPSYTSGYNNIGVNYQLKKQYQTAKNWYFKAVECNAEYKTAHVNLTDIFDIQKYTDQQIINESKKYKIIEEMFYYELGLSYYDKGKIENSIKWHKRAIACNNKNHKFYNSLAIALDQQKQYSQAIQNYQKCIQLCPDYFSAYYNTAITYKNQGDIQKTLTWYKKCIQINPKHSYSYNNIGNIYKNNNQFQQAIKYYLKAIEHLCTYTLAYTNLGICYYKTRRFLKAIQCFKRAEELFPTDNNSLSKSNKQFLEKELKRFKNQTIKWIKTGILSPQMYQIKQTMVRQYQQKFNQIFIESLQLKINPQYAQQMAKQQKWSDTKQEQQLQSTINQ